MPADNIERFADVQWKHIPHTDKDSLARAEAEQHCRTYGLAPPVDKEWYEVRHAWFARVCRQHARARAKWLKVNGKGKAKAKQIAEALERLCVSLDNSQLIARVCIAQLTDGLDSSASVELLNAQQSLKELCALLGHTTESKLAGTETDGN